MPLVTVLRARLDEITNWSLIPAPRPIELPELASTQKAGQEKTNDLTKDGSAPQPLQKRAESSKWGPEQQVAFSVWALGRTGTVATASAPTNPGPAVARNDAAQTESAKKATVPVASAPIAEPSRIGTTENQASNAVIAFVAPQEAPAKPVFKAAEPVEEHKQEAAKESPTLAESHTQSIPSPASGSAPNVVAQPTPASDASFTAPMVAHARAADPAAENKSAPALALTAPRPGFLRQNINPLVLLIVAAFGAGYCFRNWFLTNARTLGTTMSLTRPGKDE
jgi:hypothetical protein